MKREHSLSLGMIAVSHTRIASGIFQKTSRVLRNYFAVANILRHEYHNHFIQKVNIQLLRRVLIVGNAGALTSLGHKHLFEVY